MGGSTSGVKGRTCSTGAEDCLRFIEWGMHETPPHSPPSPPPFQVQRKINRPGEMGRGVMMEAFLT